MKIAIVFHSVMGNTYLMAQAFAHEFKNLGHDVNLLRVTDEDWVKMEDAPNEAKALLKTMMALPEAKPDDLLSADLVVLGSPTYFGNVTAEMKTFMDQTGGLWFQASLVGKKAAAFASAGGAEGGGPLTLQAIQTYFQYMGMATQPVPANLIKGQGWPALGLVQYSYGQFQTSLDEKIAAAVAAWAKHLSVQL